MSLPADTIVKELNETVRLTPKVEPQDDPVEDFQDDIAMETDESLQDVPQCNTQRITTQSDQDLCHIIEELSEMYLHITLPYLERANLNLQWVYKILSREEGCERVVYEFPNKDDKKGFLLIRDSKWDGINLDRLHLIAIAYTPGIMSLRDLGVKHLGLLQNISSTGKDVIMKKYNVVGTRLRIFLQYAPSFYHLHVHFTAMNDDICIIQNIQMVPTYYQVARLSICLKESDELFKEFEAQGRCSNKNSAFLLTVV
ncbi:hypothetical protein J437_LFUL016915 [Ladona fulva]|uniref:M7GpppX diphosphatase n=1 Tax=Ladona fulva TaxID=123851 RepID=A0A8K0KMP0_LADFU|nr:hypothetical protein J437_LFUL016915 [Ladona fulva]